MADYSLKVVKPLSITDAMLISTDVTEADYSAWAVGTTYALGDRVIVVADHSVYESLQAGNTGHTPSSSPTWWIKVSPTNRWKLFDTSNSTQTAKSTSMTYTIRPGTAISAISALNLTGVLTIRVRVVDPTYGTVYDETRSLVLLPSTADWWAWLFGIRSYSSLSLFFNIPSFPNANVIVDFSGNTSMAVGVLLLGQSTPIGTGIEYGSSVGIRDYSKKETNDFGDTVLIQRAYAKRANFNMKLRKSEVDSAQDLLTALRATPCLWIGSSEYNSTIVYGFYRDFDINIAYPTYSDCSIEIEGLT